MIPFFARTKDAAESDEKAVPGDKEEESSGKVASHGHDQQTSAFSGTEYGTAVHRLLELFDYTRFPNPALVERSVLYAWRRELADSGRIPASYAEDLPAGGIIAFLHSDLAKRMADAEARGELFREQPFVLGVEASLLRPEFPSEETVLVQGIIDAYFIENGELVLVDYKTDRVSDPQALIDRYQVQLDLYERALTQITGMNVREKLIYAIALKRVITL